MGWREIWKDIPYTVNIYYFTGDPFCLYLFFVSLICLWSCFCPCLEFSSLFFFHLNNVLLLFMLQFKNIITSLLETTFQV